MFRAYYVTKQKNLYIVRHIDYRGVDVEISKRKTELEACEDALTSAIATGLRVCMGQPIPPSLLTPTPAS